MTAVCRLLCYILHPPCILVSHHSFWSTNATFRLMQKNSKSNFRHCIIFYVWYCVMLFICLFFAVDLLYDCVRTQCHGRLSYSWLLCHYSSCKGMNFLHHIQLYNNPCNMPSSIKTFSDSIVILFSMKYSLASKSNGCLLNITLQKEHRMDADFDKVFWKMINFIGVIFSFDRVV